MPPRADVPRVEEYRLELDVDFLGQSWSGSNEFEVTPVSPTLALDADRLEIASVRVDGAPVEFRVEPEQQQLVIPMPKGGARPRVRVEFSGRVDPHQMLGLYRSRAPGGYVLTSQCGATGARRIFPCLDRPDRRARVALRVSADAALEVVANMPPESVESIGGRRRWSFPPTPSMATYLFYLGIGAFERRRGPPTGRVEVSVVASPGLAASGQFALEVAPRLIRFFEEYYGIPYPLPKMDLVAVSEHGWGAMENWGAITFRETRLLLDERSGEYDRRLAFITLAHELAHQWFGNLVTLAWWDDAWLNESFASLLAYKAIDRLDPKLEIFHDYLIIDPGRALPADSLMATASVVQPIERAEEIVSAFDPTISYGKGAALLRMIESYLGEEAFRRGVTRYLKAHAGGNATTRDLWEALAAETGEAIPEILGPWVERPGLPVVEARLEATGIELRQRRFLLDGRRVEEVWPIPLVLDVDRRSERRLFATARASVPIPSGTTVHLNPNANGFFRALYDPVLYDRLLGGFADRSVYDRWTVLSDLHAFYLSGDVGFEQYARFVRATQDASDYSLVYLVSYQLRDLYAWAPDAPEIADLNRTYFAVQSRRLGASGSPSDAPGTGALREAVLSARAQVDDGYAREVAELFPKWSQLDADLRQAVAIGRARSDPRLALAEFRQRLAQRLSEGEAWRLHIALGWLTDPEGQRTVLDGCLNGWLNKGNVCQVLLEMARNPAARAEGWSWYRAHGDEVDSLFRGTVFLGQLLGGSIPLFGLGRAEEVRAYFAAHRYPEGARGIDRGLEMLTIAERFRERVRRAPVG